LLRIFWTDDRNVVASAIREIIECDVPAIGNYEGRLIVQRVDCSAEEEILILLQAGEKGLSRKELGTYVHQDPPRITEGLTRLQSSTAREILKLGSGNFRLTDLGIQRVLKELAPKLVL
jgi:hypothetical protein